jgi:hypothetical protein
LLECNPRVKKRGKVQKVIKSTHSSIPEKAEIEIEGADDLYKEIRIENTLQDEEGHKVKLKEEADVDVVIEADRKATTPKED